MADTTSNTAPSANSRAPRTTVHTPLIRLQAARRAYDMACEACPHSGDHHGEFMCCRELTDAQREFTAARLAVRS